MIGSARPLFAACLRAARRPGFFALPAVALAFLFAQPAPQAYADTIVSGSMDSVKLEARASSVGEVLKTLSDTFPIRYRTAIELNRPVTGTFSGPALKVISSILHDYDYVVRHTAAGGFEVVVIKFGGRESSKVISTIVNTGAPAYPATEVNTGNPAIKGGPYPHPQWRARSYSRTMQPNTTP